MSGARRPLRPEQLWPALAATALLVALVLAALWLRGVHVRAADRLAEIEPRHARLTGMLQNGEQLARAEQAAQANLALFIHPAAADAGQVANGVLQRVRELAAAQELRVTSSQVTAPAEDKNNPEFERVGLSLRIEGDWSRFQALLAALPRERPAIYSQTVQIYAQGLPGRAPGTQAQLDLFVLKERKP